MTNSCDIKYKVFRQEYSSYDLNELLYKLNTNTLQNNHNCEAKRKFVIRKSISYDDFMKFCIVCDVSSKFVQAIHERMLLFLKNYDRILILFDVRLNDLCIFVDRYW